MRRPLLLLALAGAAAALFHRRQQAQRAEQDLWIEAAAAPDLR